MPAMRSAQNTRYTPEKRGSEMKDSNKTNKDGLLDKDKDPLNEITHLGPNSKGQYQVYRIWKSITEPRSGRIWSVMVHWRGWNQEDSTEERVSDIEDTEAYQHWLDVWKGHNERGVYEVEDIIGEKEVDGELWVKIWWAGKPWAKAKWQRASSVIDA